MRVNKSNLRGNVSLVVKMKKFLKITGFSFLGIIVLAVLAMVLIPILFKDDIKKAVDETVEEYVNAKVNYKDDGLSLSLFSDFPNAQVGIEGISILNNEPFEGDTFVSIKDLKVSIDVMSLFGDEFQINSVYLNTPRIFAHVNDVGFASWDITYPDTIPNQESSSTPFALNVDKWEIENGYVEYEDELMPMLATITNLNHTGSGNIADIIAVSTNTTADKVYVNHADVTYLNNVSLNAKTDLDIEGNKYTFRENSLKLNDFNLHFDGFTELTLDTTKLDITLDADKSNFKQLISLIPAVFLEGYENIEANGDFKFDGKIKGALAGEQIPNFDLNLLVENGDFKYPELPKKVEDINLDINVKNVSSNIDATVINAKKLNLKMGESNLSGRLLLAGLTNYYVDTDLKLDVDLSSIKDYYPLDGNTLKGKFHLEALGKGKVDVDNGSFPGVTGNASLRNGFVKTADFDLPVENINFASVFSSNGTTAGSNVEVKNLSLLLDGQEFGGDIKVQNFDEINYLADLSGKLDLGKLFKVFPLEGMTISKGILTVNNFTTEGNMNAIETEDYASLKTSGSATLTDFLYKDEEYIKNGFAISKTDVSFTPDKILISYFEGMLGKSDMNIKGHVSNYMGFLFSDTDSTLGGTMTLNSKKFDVNPFLEDTEEGTVETTTAPAPTEVTPIPRNIHFFFDANINQFVYDDLSLDDFIGKLEIVDGAVVMQNVGFSTLGADFITSGSYDTKNPKSPAYDFNLNIEDMDIGKAYKYFNVVKELAPLGNKIDGSFNTDIKMKGNLLPDYMPDLNTLSLSGILDVVKATTKVSDMKALSGLVKTTKLSGIKEFVVENEKMDVQVEDGKLWIKPFTMKSGDANLTAQLNNGLADNSINHHMLLDIPSTMMKTGLSSFGLNADALGDRIDLDFDVTGTRTNPKVNFKKGATTSIKDAVKDNAKQKVDEAKAEFQKSVDEELAKKKAEAKAKADAAKAKAKAEAKVKADAAKAKAKEEAAKKAQEAKDNLKDKIKIPSW